MWFRTKHAVLIAVGILFSMLLGGLVAHHVRAKEPLENSAVENTPPAPVAVVKLGTISNSISVAGEFIPYQEVELHAKVAGYIRKINVDIGDPVHTGEVLALLEVPELNAQVTGAEAGVQHSKEEILRLKSEVVRADADHASVHSEAERLQQVFATQPGLIAQQELDNILAKDRSSEAQVEAAKSALAAAEQALAGSQATRTQMAAMQEYSRIVAPFDGVVIWRYADTGSLIQAGTSNSNSLPVVKVAQINVLRLRLPVPESVAAHVRVGTKADIHVQATGEHISGKVARLTDSFDRSTRTMQVEIDVPNQARKLSPGMYADVSLLLENRTGALTVPIQALSRENDKTTVLLVNQQGRVERREIKTGLEEPDRVEVLKGLNAGDRVIVGNFAAYRPGQLVNAKVSAFDAGGDE
ncbi:MAG TPA: efflux RND transporter periplasmic adaptor subunit [Candidatus Angelobacter sp.]|jgi:RND family efflux transporter MFP subunit